jgi:hypothetical protein
MHPISFPFMLKYVNAIAMKVMIISTLFQKLVILTGEVHHADTLRASLHGHREPTNSRHCSVALSLGICER